MHRRCECSHHMLVYLGPLQILVIVSVCASSRTAKGVPLAPKYGFPIQKQRGKQTVDISASLYYYADRSYLFFPFSFLILFSHSFFSFLLLREMRHKCHYSVAVNFHHDSMAQISGPAFLQHIHKLHELTTSHTHFTPVSIHAPSTQYQRNMKIFVCNVESVPHVSMVLLASQLRGYRQ